MVFLFVIYDVVIVGLKEKYQEAIQRDDVKAIVVTGELDFSWFQLLNEVDSVQVIIVGSLGIN
jgi:hypothetical protein